LINYGAFLYAGVGDLRRFCAAQLSNQAMVVQVLNILRAGKNFLGFAT